MSYNYERIYSLNAYLLGAKERLSTHIREREEMLPLLRLKRPQSVVEKVMREIELLKKIYNLLERLSSFNQYLDIANALEAAVATDAHYLSVLIAIKDSGDFSKTNQLTLKVPR